MTLSNSIATQRRIEKEMYGISPKELKEFVQSLEPVPLGIASKQLPWTCARLMILAHKKFAELEMLAGRAAATAQAEAVRENDRWRLSAEYAYLDSLLKIEYAALFGCELEDREVVVGYGLRGYLVIIESDTDDDEGAGGPDEDEADRLLDRHFVSGRSLPPPTGLPN